MYTAFVNLDDECCIFHIFLFFNGLNNSRNLNYILEISEDKTSGICSLCCLASCLNSASNLFMPESVENTEIVHLLYVLKIFNF